MLKLKRARLIESHFSIEADFAEFRIFFRSSRLVGVAIHFAVESDFVADPAGATPFAVVFKSIDEIELAHDGAVATDRQAGGLLVLALGAHDDPALDAVDGNVEIRNLGTRECQLLLLLSGIVLLLLLALGFLLERDLLLLGVLALLGPCPGSARWRATESAGEVDRPSQLSGRRRGEAGACVVAARTHGDCAERSQH